MKVWYHHPLLLAITIYLYLLGRETMPWTVLVLCAFLWLLRTGKKGAVFTALLLLLCSIPRWDTQVPAMTQGKAVIVNGSYAVLQNGRERLLVYTEEPFLLDAEYRVSGEPETIAGSHGFFQFDYAQWAHSLGVYYSVAEENTELVQEHITLRSHLQKKIESCTEEEKKMQLYRILLNIRTGTEEDSFLYQSGFSYAGILGILDYLLKYVFDRRKRSSIMIGINGFLCLFYHCPLLLMQSLIFRILRKTDAELPVRTGLGLSIVMLLYPSSVRSVSFLIPAVYRIGSLVKEERKVFTFTSVMIVQSLFYQQMNPLQSLLFPLMQKMLGVLWIAGVIQLWCPLIHTAGIWQALNSILSFPSRFALQGSVFGCGLPFFLLLCLNVRKRKHPKRWICGLLLLFECTGLFHPFAEMTFINVGQGDSILLRAPLNICNILIDTGKPSQWSTLQAMLNGKGIRTLSKLIITHSDNDHSGNQENVQNTYDVEETITTHIPETEAGPFVLYDLNTIADDDENESSITTYVQCNGLKFLLMGDCDETAEDTIALAYSGLHADVLKLSHHGSSTGSSERFLNTVQPGLAVISAGAYSIYHHPSEQTIQRLLKRHIPYLNTREEGDITILFLPHLNLLVTSTGKIAIM